jgi:hypothetical protein
MGDMSVNLNLSHQLDRQSATVALGLLVETTLGLT